MSRKPRTHVPGGFYHVILRGNSRREIFKDAADRYQWQGYLQDGVDFYGSRIHAYCWMTNHVHMAVQVGQQQLGRFVGTVATRYAKAFNKKYGRTGHLFERRHAAILVREDNHLLELVRYIHQNPLRANMVRALSDYNWSSHIAYAGGPHPGFLTTSVIAALFGARIAERRERYLEFVGAPPTPSVTKLICSEPAPKKRSGKVELRNDAESHATPGAEKETLDQLIERLCDDHGYTEADITCSGKSRGQAHVRALIALEATHRGLATVSELATRFGRSQPALSRAMNKLRRQSKML
jgi:REP element-mobilizing transposase RayT